MSTGPTVKTGEKKKSPSFKPMGGRKRKRKTLQATESVTYEDN